MIGQKSSFCPGVRRGFEGGQMPLYRRIPKLRGIAGACFRGFETVSARQLWDALLMDKRRMEKEIHRANTSFNIFMMKSTRIENQVYLLFATGYMSLEIQILSCGCFLAVEILLGPGSATLENTRKKFLDVKRLSLQVRESLEELQSKVDKSRLALMGVLIELEKERFDKKRMEEELDISRRKVLRLQA